MSVREIRQPGPEHPITIAACPGRIVVSVAGHTVADTRRAVTLREASYAPVHYIPLADVDRSLLQRSEHTSYCPYKGEASYYDIPLGGERGANAVWQYEDPYTAVAQIRDRVAFYPDRVELVVEEDDSI